MGCPLVRSRYHKLNWPGFTSLGFFIFHNALQDHANAIFLMCMFIMNLAATEFISATPLKTQIGKVLNWTRFEFHHYLLVKTYQGNLKICKILNASSIIQEQVSNSELSEEFVDSCFFSSNMNSALYKQLEELK